MEVICGETIDDARVADGVAHHRNSVADLALDGWRKVGGERVSRGRALGLWNSGCTSTGTVVKAA